MSNRQHVISAVCCTVGLLLQLSFGADAREVMGKVIAVYHEPVTLNNKVFDKVSVTVGSCAPNNELITAHYAPGFVSDDNSLGFLYTNQAVAARSMVSKNQYMNSINGHVTLQVNDQTKAIEKTTFWGYNWECGRNVDNSASLPGAGNFPAARPGGATPPPQQQGGPKRNFGGMSFPGLGF